MKSPEQKKERQREFNANLGGWLRRNRESLKLSQDALAEAVGVAAGSVSAWENGAMTPSAYYYVRLFRFFEAEWEKRDRAARAMAAPSAPSAPKMQSGNRPGITAAGKVSA